MNNSEQYDFYVHYVDDAKGGRNKVKPTPEDKKPNEVIPNTDGEDGSDEKVPYVPTSIFSPKKAVGKFGAVAKASVFVASSLVVASAVDKAIGYAGELLAGYNGNYELSRNHANFHAVLSNVTNPLGLVNKAIQSDMQVYQETSKKNQEALLTGNEFLRGS